MTSGEMIKTKNEFFSLDAFFVFIYSSAISERGVVTSSESTTGFLKKSGSAASIMKKQDLLPVIPFLGTAGKRSFFV